MGRRTIIGIGAAVAALILVISSAFTVSETNQALVMQFGRVVRPVEEAGLHFKIPFIQNAAYLEKRVLSYDIQPQEVILGDSKRLVVDSFARYRIVDPQQFYQRIRTELGLQGQMQPIISSAMRNVLGEVPLFTVLSPDRTGLMQRIQDRANQTLGDYGVDVVDIRIKRADLPQENSEAIFRRMQSERQREARELRAQGAELAERIRARAERERTVLLAEARRDADILRGEGDAQATTIFAQAYSQDTQFFNFYRSMQAYRDSLKGENTNFIMSPDDTFFRFFDRNLVDAMANGREQAPTDGDGVAGLDLPDPAALPTTADEAAAAAAEAAGETAENTPAVQ